MAICPNCRRELREGAKFCTNCGAQVPEQTLCPRCGAPLAPGAAFCQFCGAPASAPAPNPIPDPEPIPEHDPAPDSDPAPMRNTDPASEPEPVQTPDPTSVPAPDPAPAPDPTPVPAPPIHVPRPEPKPKRKKRLPLWIPLVVLGVVIIAAAVFALNRFGVIRLGGADRGASYSLYIMDRNLYYSGLKKNRESVQMTSRLLRDTDWDNEDLYNGSYGSSIASLTYLSEDGGTLIYPDRLSGSGNSLYWRKVNNTKAEPVRIDNQVVAYIVSESVDSIVYLKDDGNLYRYTLKSDSRDKLGSDVDRFRASADGKQVLWLNSDDDLYLHESGERTKLASEVSEFIHVNDDFSAIYYVKDDTLYRQTRDGERDKLAEELSTVCKVYPDGAMYYTRRVEEEFTMMDFVDDDMAEADAAVTEPEAPTAPRWTSYDTNAEYEAAYARYEEEYERYEQAYAEYEQVYYRGLLREDLREATLTRTRWEYCYYDGSGETVLGAAYGSANTAAASDTPVLVFTANEAPGFRVPISELESVYDVEDRFYDELGSDARVCVAAGARVTETEGGASDFAVNSAGSTVYYFDGVRDEEGDLYRVQIKNGSVGTPERRDTDVTTRYYSFLTDDRFVYMKDWRDGGGELYLNGEKIDYDVSGWTARYNESQNMLFYLTDWSDRGDSGTLMAYKNGKQIKIANDVYTWTVTPDGTVLYLYDYSARHGTGTVYAWKNDDGRRLDDDVSYLLPYSSNRYKCPYYVSYFLQS